MPIGLILALMAAQAPASPSIEGRWRSPGGNSIIEIGPCDTGKCGTVAWASAKAKQDARKAAPELVGTALLTGLKQDPKGRWRGRLFIPDKNMRVTAKLQLVGDQQLKVSGCVAGRALCQSSLWTRAEGPLPIDD